jgi:hypothetical protein
MPYLGGWNSIQPPRRFERRKPRHQRGSEKLRGPACIASVPSGCRTWGSSRTSLPSLRHWTAIFVATVLWRWTGESWATGHACKIWHTVSSAPQPPLHLLSSTGLEGIPTVGRFAVRRCTARTQSPPDHPLGGWLIQCLEAPSADDCCRPAEKHLPEIARW